MSLPEANRKKASSTSNQSLTILQFQDILQIKKTKIVVFEVDLVRLIMRLYDAFAKKEKETIRQCINDLVDLFDQHNH